MQTRSAASHLTSAKKIEKEDKEDEAPRLIESFALRPSNDTEGSAKGTRLRLSFKNLIYFLINYIIRIFITSVKLFRESWNLKVLFNINKAAYFCKFYPELFFFLIFSLNFVEVSYQFNFASALITKMFVCQIIKTIHDTWKKI